jgi:hypothetical protein
MSPSFSRSRVGVGVRVGLLHLIDVSSFNLESRSRVELGLGDLGI